MQVFDFNNNDVRVIPEGDRLWFVAKDITDGLGYASASQALRHVPDAHRGVRKVDTPSWSQDMACVDEPGMYWLVMRSNRLEARPFIDWVTGEVLPSIRKTGGYSVSEDPDRVAFRASLFEPRDRVVFLVREIDRLQGELDSLIKGE